MAASVCVMLACIGLQILTYLTATSASVPIHTIQIEVRGSRFPWREMTLSQQGNHLVTRHALFFFGRSAERARSLDLLNRTIQGKSN